MAKAKAKQVLGWAPEVGFKQLVERMVDADMARLTPQAGLSRVVPAAADPVQVG